MPGAPDTASHAAILERRLGALLILMRNYRVFLRLGFVRLGDYVEERLGLSLRTAQELMRTEEALGSLPLTAAAYETGRITASHVRVLVRVAGRENERHWVGLACRLGVRAFESRAKRRAIATGEPEAEEKPRLLRLRFAVPWAVAILWRNARVTLSQLMGRRLPPGACLEMLLADFAASLPDRPTSPPGLDAPDARATGSEPQATIDEASRLPGDPPEKPASHATDGARRPGSCGDRDAPILPDRPPDPCSLDRELVQLATNRQRQEAALSEHLLLVAKEQAYRRFGHGSLEDYARDRFGISPRRLYYLLSLRRTILRLPRIAAAFLAGKLTLKKLLLLGKVADRFSEIPWIDRARSVTLRRLEDEIAFWTELRESRPAVWRLMNGRPIPEGIVLLPGKAPRLARGDGADDLAQSAWCRDGGREPGLHGSALSAEALIAALNEDETLTPLPSALCHLEVYVEEGVDQLWREVKARCRDVIGRDLSEEDLLALALAEFQRTWDNDQSRRTRRRHRTLERDGWRCTAPGCRSIGSGQLQEHHIRYRAAGGSVDDPSNLTTLCSAHHLNLLHHGWIRCRGTAPDRLRWDYGRSQGGTPFLIFENEKLIFAAD